VTTYKQYYILSRRFIRHQPSQSFFFFLTQWPIKYMSTLDESKLKGLAFNFDLSRVLKYQEFELSSLIMKTFELLSFPKKNLKSSKNLAKKNCRIRWNWLKIRKSPPKPKKIRSSEGNRTRATQTLCSTRYLSRADGPDSIPVWGGNFFRFSRVFSNLSSLYRILRFFISIFTFFH